MLARAGLIYRTVRHIPPMQLSYFFVRRVLPEMPAKSRGVTDRSRWTPLPTPVQEGLPSPHPELMQDRLVFLNQASHFKLDAIDWRSSEMPKLWRYHLHYFDWLKSPTICNRQAASTIIDWIEKNPPGSLDAWEPYTVSLRIVNWIKYFLRMRNQGLKIPVTWIESLESQVKWLGRNIEWHIMANHLFKNIVALVWAKAFFRQSDSDTSLQYYLSLLSQQLDEQFNNDGGHFERSPSYHALCIEDCIDVLNLLVHIDLESPIVSRLNTVIHKGLVYLKALSFEDGYIALLGDSTLHGAHQWAELFYYWRRINPAVPLLSAGLSGLEMFADSGFCVFSNSAYQFIFSIGSVSPAYQPGHTHCDVGGFELFSITSGRRLLVDSGVSQYAAGPMRQYVRSSAAHNVLTVNEQNQHEIWGEFRVGGRMIVVSVEAGEVEGAPSIRLETQSHSSAETPYVHVRTIICRPDSVLIRDQVKVSGTAAVSVRFNVHPEVGVVVDGANVALEADGKIVAGLRGGKGFGRTVSAACYCPDFGVVQRSNQLVYSSDVEESATFDTCICIL